MTTTQARGRNLVLVAMIVVVAMTFIDMTIVSIAAPDIQKGLDLTSTDLQWIVSGYLVALAAFFALGGRLADVVGHRTVVVVGTLLFIGSSVACGATPTGSGAATWIITFRVVQGAGAALLFPAALAVVLSAFPVETRGSAVARFFAVTGGLTAVGPFAGAFLIGISWRWIFFINVPVAGLGLILTFVAKVDNRRRPDRIDLVGALLIAVGAGALVVGLQQASTWGWSDLKTLVCLAGGIVVLGVFVEVERSRTEPLIRMQFFENRTFRSQNVILFFASAAFVPVFFFASIYAQVSLGWTAQNAGTYLLTFFAGFAPGAIVGGKWLDRGAAKRAAVWGGVLGAIGFFAWAARLPGLTENTQWPWIVLAGLGLGLVIGSANTDAVNQVPSEHFGEATGVTQTVRNLGAALGLAVLGTMFSSALRHRIEDSLAGFGISRAKADAVASALHGSGSGESTRALAAQAGPKADAVFGAVRVDFADATQIVFHGMGVAMAIVALVAVVGLTRGQHRPNEVT